MKINSFSIFDKEKEIINIHYNEEGYIAVFKLIVECSNEDENEYELIRNDQNVYK